MGKLKTAKESLGYIGLGILIDYAIFKPVRKLRFLWFFGTGFIAGMIYTWGFDKIMTAIKNWFMFQ
ncbi:hypothetical protein KJ632_00815 [Patescibacteria group bacterium]|nr:hypothetical protein [Patescibacteria group bacterium]